MIIFGLTFLLVFILVVGAGVLFFDDSGPMQISAAIDPDFGGPVAQKKLRTAVASVGKAVGGLERFLPKSQKEMSLVRQRLARAGFRKDSAVRYFYGAKVAAMLLLGGPALAFFANERNFLFVVGASMGFGYLGPDFWLSRRVASRMRRIRRDLPDLIDLLIVCIEAGLSLDQATMRTVEEMGKSGSPLCEEVGLVVLEQRAGAPRMDAWKNLADRVNEESVRNVVMMLVQAEQFGTSVAKALRVHAETVRTQRVQQVEEMAAKTTVKILFPLVLLIFPALFVVTLGPAIILVMESFNASH